MNLAPVVLCATLALSSLTAVAGDVVDLNSARVPVADRSDTEFKRGVAKALEAVIIKLTGSSAVARTKRARAVIGHAQRLVQQFGYERLRSRTAGAGTLVLRVEFDARVLAEEMRSRQLVVWGKERPDTLVWLMVEDESGRRLLGAHDENVIIRVLKNRASARGIPLIFPLADIAESSAAAGASSAAELGRALHAGAQRYGVRSVFSCLLTQVVPTLWEAEWRLIVQGESVDWEQQGDLVELLVAEAAESLADVLGRRFAAPATHLQADTVQIVVNGLTSALDYARVERYLRTIDSVTRLMVERVDEQGIVFDLTVRGGLVVLRQIISFGQTLSADPVSPTVFRLNPQ